MSLSPLLLWARRLRVDGVPLTVLAVTVFLTSALAAAAPMLAVRASHDALRQQIDRASAPERTVVVTAGQELRSHALGDLGDEARRIAARVDNQIPVAVHAVLEEPSTSYETESWSVEVQGAPPNPFGRLLLLLARDGADGRVTFTEGRSPRGASITPPEPVTSQLDPPNPATVHLELVISEATADAMGIAVGDRLDMTTRSLLGGVTLPGEAEPIVIGEVVGVFAVDDPEEAFWAGDRRLVAPNVGDSGASGAALVSHDGLETLLTAWPRIVQLTYAYRADAERLAAASPARLAVDFNDLRNAFSGFDVATLLPVQLRTGIPTLLATYLAGQRQAFLLLGLVGLGVGGIAAAAIILLAVLLADRRRPALVIQRERGAGAEQILLPALVEAVAICLPAAVGGWLLARLLVAEDAGDLPLQLAGLVAGVAVAACVALLLPVGIRDLRSLLRDRVVQEHPTARRLVAEGLVVALAVLGVLFARSHAVRRRLTINKIIIIMKINTNTLASM